MQVYFVGLHQSELMTQFIVHYGLHFLFPGMLAYLLFRPRWKTAWLIMVFTMLIDLDHLLANPMFDPNRCSINFHPLHTSYALVFYLMLLFPKKSRIVAVGLLFHLFTDYLDCLMMGV